jgi:SAM-dependent methyltransferase
MNPAEFNYIAAAEERMWWFRGMRRILFELLDPLAASRRFERVLEAGCGTGANARRLAARYGWPITAIDLAAEGLRHARALGVPRLAQADVTALPFRDEGFDLLLSLDVLPHFAEGREGFPLGEFARVVAPGGWLVMRCAALRMLASRHSEFVHEQQRFTRGGLCRAIEASGFRVHRATYVNSLLMPVALAKFRIWEPLTRARPASGVRMPASWVNRVLELPLRAEAALLRRGMNFPLGQSVVVLAQRR